MLCSRLLILTIFAAVSARRKFGPLRAFLNLPEVSQILNVTDSAGHDVWGCRAFCDHVVCVNGGTCQSLNVCRGNCICPPGFTGRRCEVMVEEPDADPSGIGADPFVPGVDPLGLPSAVLSTERVADTLRQTGVDPVQQLFLMKNYLTASFTDN